MSGFNPQVARLTQPPIPLVQGWAKAWDRSKGALIDLSQAVPGYATHPTMLQLLSEAAGQQANTGYGPIEGETVLREALAAQEAALYRADITADNVHITSGCNQAFLASMLAVARSGDRILVSNPFYFNHETTLMMMGIGISTVECHAGNGFLPQIADIADAITPDIRALAFVSPNNPTGAVLPPELLSEIFDLCQANGIWLVLDETYRDFLQNDGAPPHNLFQKPDWQNTLISLYSFSKSYCIPGHRLGAITSGPAMVEQVAKVMDNLQICPPRSAQLAVARAMPILGDWRDENRQEIARRAEALHQTLAQAPGWDIAAIGAYFAFIRHPFADIGSFKVAEKLAVEAGIVCLPGMFFGERQDQFLRFAFANADSDTIAGLGPRLAAFSID